MDLKNFGNATNVEIVNCIEEAGLTPNEKDLTQLAQAVKAMAGSGTAPLTHYSLNEQWTGKYWIDGKKVYEKTVQITLESDAGELTRYPHDIESMEWLVCAQGTYCNNGNPLPLPYVPVGGETISIGFYIDGPDIIFRTWDKGRNGPVVLTLRYTCTDR